MTGPVSQSGAESEYNAACTAGMALVHFRMLIHEFLNKDTDIVPEEDPLNTLDRKSAMCMANNDNDTKHIRHITRRIHFLGTEKSARCTKFIVVNEVCNW